MPLVPIAFDFEAAETAAQSVIWRQKWRAVRLILLPVISHLGSIVTIAVAWFARSGQLQFHPDAFIDWAAVGLAGLLASSGIYLVWRAMTFETVAIVSREELGLLLAVVRRRAESSIMIVAGDLSWLNADLPALIAIKKTKPHVRMCIFYDKVRVGKNEISVLEILEQHGITFRSYDSSASTARFTLIDMEDSDSRAGFMYSHTPAPSILDRRQRDAFIWQEFKPNDNITKALLPSLVRLFERVPTKSLKIGVCGVNNVGKTTFTKLLSDELRSRFDVKLIPDQYRLVPDGTTIEGNMSILISELVDLQEETEHDIVIYDRTPLDNFLYFKLRHSARFDTGQIVRPVVDAVKELDMIIFIRASSEGLASNTSYVSAAERKFVQDTFDDYFTQYYLDKEEIAFRWGFLAEDAHKHAAQMAAKAREVVNSRRVASIKAS